MDYSTNWVSTSTGSSITLRLLDDSPVRDPKEEQKSSASIEEELGRVSAENKKLMEMLAVACQKYNALRNQLMAYMSNTNSNIIPPSTDDDDNNNNNNNNNSTAIDVSFASKKRKSDSCSYNMIRMGPQGDRSSSSDEEEDSCSKKAKKCEPAVETTNISKSYVRTEASDTSLILKDGYQWRKYGQKVTRDNPCPRAYFKCSFAPTCPVKKKVQRSLEDQRILVATYEGEHNHPPPPSQPQQGSTSSAAAGNHRPCLASGNGQPSGAAAATISSTTLEVVKPKPTGLNSNCILDSSSKLAAGEQQRTSTSSEEFHKYLVEQMASSLTKDPNFTAALAAAMSGS